MKNEKKFCAVCKSMEGVNDYRVKEGPKIRLCYKCAAGGWSNYIDWKEEYDEMDREEENYAREKGQE